MISATTNYQNALAGFKTGKIVYAIEIVGYNRVFTNHVGAYSGSATEYPWLGELDNLSQTLNDLEGGADQVSWGFTVQDHGVAITGDMPSFVFEGAYFTFKTGFVGLAYSDFTTVFQGKIDHVTSVNANLAYYFSCVDNSDALTKVIYGIADDGGETSGDHVKTLNAHPLDIMLDALLNECALPASQVDSAKIIEYRDGPFAGTQFLFKLQQGVAAAEFIKQQLLKPLGGYMYINAAGQVTVNFFYPIEGPIAVGSLTRGSFFQIPEADQTEMVNTVQMQFDKDDSGGSSGNYLSISTQTYGPSVARYGQYGEHVVAADGMRSGFQGFFLAAITSRLIFLRYGFKNLIFAGNAETRWNTLRYEAGDLLSITHSDVPDRAAGVMGITNKLFEVLDKEINFTEGKIIYTLLDASYLSTFGFYKITPRNEAAYAAASTADKAKYMFMCGENGEYSNNDSGHQLG